jgi:hypothetical protein
MAIGIAVLNLMANTATIADEKRQAAVLIEPNHVHFGNIAQKTVLPVQLKLSNTTDKTILVCYNQTQRIHYGAYTI